MHDALKSSSGYHKELDEALNDEFLRRTLDTFAVAYRANREAVFKEVDETALIKQIADAKDYACQHMDELYAQFKAEAEKRGILGIYNTNELLSSASPHFYPGAYGIKSGFTNAAGFCYVGAAKKDDSVLYAAILKSRTRNRGWDDMANLFNYGFASIAE